MYSFRGFAEAKQKISQFSSRSRPSKRKVSLHSSENEIDYYLTNCLQTHFVKSNLCSPVSLTYPENKEKIKIIIIEDIENVTNVQWQRTKFTCRSSNYLERERKGRRWSITRLVHVLYFVGKLFSSNDFLSSFLSEIFFLFDKHSCLTFNLHITQNILSRCWKHPLRSLGIKNLL